MYRAGSRFTALGLYDADVLPGDVSDYPSWVAAVKAAGGTITAMPGEVPPPPAWNPFKPSTWFGAGRGDQTIPAARYPMEIWVPKVNARAWPLPDAYSANGQLAYYAASDHIVNAAHRLAEPTLEELAKANKSLLPDWWESAGTAVKWGIGGLALLLALEVVRAIAPRGNP